MTTSEMGKHVQDVLLQVHVMVLLSYHTVDLHSQEIHTAHMAS